MVTTKTFAPKMPTPYLRAFFAEKDIEHAGWTIEDADGMAHIIDNLVVVERMTTVSKAEAKQIEGVLRKIDFANGDVNHFLRHLAGAIVAAY